MRLSSLILSSLIPSILLAAPQDHGRLIDEDGGSWISPEVGLIGLIILLVISIIGYFNLKDENGKKDEGCGCMIIMIIAAILFGVAVVSK